MKIITVLIDYLRSNPGGIIIVIAAAAAWLIYDKILGNPGNFVGGSILNEPLRNNYLGILYKGGYIMVVLLTFMIVLITYITERFFSVSRAGGSSGNREFLGRVISLFEGGDTVEAVRACDEQKGSVSNVVRNGFETIMKLEKESGLSREEKLGILRKNIGESTQLEVPQLYKNLIVISTLASISTLIGLLGTVVGMIKAFSALARVGTPDPIGLANGISQALVTTAMGITIAAAAIVFYNYFTARIDRIIYIMEQAAFGIENIYKAKMKRT